MFGTAISISMCLALMVPGGVASGSIEIPSDELPEGTVILVSHVPIGLGTVDRGEFRRALVQSAAAAGRRSLPKPGGDEYEKLKKVAIGERLDSIWIQGQATEMGIVVTPRQISRMLVRLKHQAFRSEAAYRRFLKESHFTRRDVRERVEIQILSMRIQERIARKATSESDQQKAFSAFVIAYEERWRARTVCAAEFVTERCSNGPLPDDR